MVCLHIRMRTVSPEVAQGDRLKDISGWACQHSRQVDGSGQDLTVGTIYETFQLCSKGRFVAVT